MKDYFGPDFLHDPISTVDIKKELLKMLEYLAVEISNFDRKTHNILMPSMIVRLLGCHGYHLVDPCNNLEELNNHVLGYLWGFKIVDDPNNKFTIHFHFESK
jgi:hypothetical protein